MDNYIAIVFETDENAFKGLHALWDLDSTGDITVHGAAVIHRDEFGHVDVATKDTDPGLRTIVGVGLGALIGALAGPVGIGIGAAAGGAAGLTADVVKANEHDEAAYETGFVMKPGQAAVIAEVSEDQTSRVNHVEKGLGGVVYRRAKGDVRETSFFGDDYNDYLYPSDYQPYFHKS